MRFKLDALKGASYELSILRLASKHKAYVTFIFVSSDVNFPLKYEYSLSSICIDTHGVGMFVPKPLIDCSMFVYGTVSSNDRLHSQGITRHEGTRRPPDPYSTLQLHCMSFDTSS